MTAGMGLLGFGIAFAVVNNNLGGLLLLLSFGLLVMGLIPCLVGTVEQQVGYALSQRLPDYQHRWSTAARRWLGAHWLMLLCIVILVITASQLQPRQGKDLAVILASLLCCSYLVMVCFVLAWRARRTRLAALAGLPDLLSFDLQLENDEALQGMEHVMPLFSGKLKGRCPYLLRGTLGDWPVMLFDWLDINKQPPRREWITIALVQLQHPLPMLHLQPHERVASTQLHWWHILLEFPFGLIIFLISAASHFASKLKSKPALTIAHTPALTRGYQLDSVQFGELQTLLTPANCQNILAHVHRRKRFLVINRSWLLLASHKKEVAPKQLGELVANALRLADVLEQAKMGNRPSSQDEL